ncbi:hypothetical protein C2845_PM03G18190 [Panicum miliaceum]|uniref:Uncharacterized protein n=1 Tax=Panicum miliaceum TaxID=4540 RepID=A0A3L6T6G8_PANMI|nr:hypothetical protein C2845_PM03G18190 [Panicum miliaceum]
MHAIRLAVHARVARQKHNQLFHIDDHRAQIVKGILQLFQNICLSIGRTYSFQRIYFGQRERMTHNLSFGIQLLVLRLVSQGVK